MQLSFCSVLSYRGAAVSVILVGQLGCFWRSVDLSLLPPAPAGLVAGVFEQLSQRSSIRELRRVRERLGEGPLSPTQLSEPLPLTFDRDPEALLDNLAKRYLS